MLNRKKTPTLVELEFELEQAGWAQWNLEDFRQGSLKTLYF